MRHMNTIISIIICTAFVTTSSNAYAQNRDSNLVRIPPIAPQDAEVSGFCCMKFDVSKKGKTKNVEANNCTHEVYRKSSEKSVKNWRYSPKYVDGKRVKRIGLNSKVVFHLEDFDGTLLYDPELYIPQLVDPEYPKGWSAIVCEP